MTAGSKAWRRRALVALLLAQAVFVHAAPDCDTLEPVPWRAVAPGAWVWLPPEGGDVSPANAGHVMPTSVLVSGRQALVIDPGPSHRHGERVRRSLACRFGAAVRWIVNTHAHSEKNALEMDYPHLLADCIKSAAKSLGKAFGRDLNRELEDTYNAVLAGLKVWE